MGGNGACNVQARAIFAFWMALEHGVWHALILPTAHLIWSALACTRTLLATAKTSRHPRSTTEVSAGTTISASRAFASRAIRILGNALLTEPPPLTQSRVTSSRNVQNVLLRKYLFGRPFARILRGWLTRRIVL